MGLTECILDFVHDFIGCSCFSYWNQMEHMQSLRTEVSYTGSQVSCPKNTVSYGAHALYTHWTLHTLNFWNLSHQMCMRKSNFELYLIWTMDLKTSVTHRCVLWFQSDCICNKTYYFPFCELQRNMFHWWMKSCQLGYFFDGWNHASYLVSWRLALKVHLLLDWMRVKWNYTVYCAKQQMRLPNTYFQCITKIDVN